MRISLIPLFKALVSVSLLSVACFVHAAQMRWDASGVCGGSGKDDVGSPGGIAAHTCEQAPSCDANFTYSCSARTTEWPSGNATVVTIVSGVHISNPSVKYGPASWDGGSGYLVPSAPEKPNCGEEPTTENPVVISRGEKNYRFEEARRGGQFPLIITRTYRSNLHHNHKVHGNWDFTYLVNRIMKINGNYPVVTQAGGKAVSFAPTTIGTGTSPNIYHDTEPGVHYELVKNKHTLDNFDDEWEFTRPDGYVEIYSDSDSSTQRAGWLKKVINPQGLSHSFVYADTTYDIYGYIVEPARVDITDDQTQKTLRWKHNLAFNPIELDEVDGEDEAWIRKYTWDNYGRLEKVIYADETTTDPDDNFVQAFLYNTDNYNPVSPQTLDDFKFLITGIEERIGETSTTGTPYSNVEYDSLGRVITSELLSGTSAVEKTTFDYNWDWSDTGTSFQPETTVTKTFPYQSTTNTIATEYAFTTGGEGITGTRSWQVKAVNGAAHTNTGCAAASTATTYDNDRYLETTEDARGYRTERARDGRGRVTTLKTGLGPSSLTANNDSKKIVTDYWGDTPLPDSRTYFGYQSGWQDYKKVTFTYYSGNNRVETRTEEDLTSTAYPDRVWSYSYEPSDTSITITQMTITDPESHQTVYDYEDGHIVSIKRYTGGTPSYLETAYTDYNAFGYPETITDPNDVVTTLVFDVQGRLESRTTSGMTTGFTYKPNGLLDVVTSPNGSTLQYIYNSAHHLTSIVNNFGESIDLTPSILDGQWTDAIVTNGAEAVVLEQHRLFDALGRLWKHVDSEAVVKTLYGYDENDNLTNIIALGDVSNSLDYDDASRVVYRAYDGQNRVIQQSRCADDETPTVPNLCSGSGVVTTDYAYDEQGNINTVTDANEHSTSYTYNGFGERVQEISPDRGTTIYEYDDAGNLVTKTKAATDTDTDGSGPDQDDTQVISYSWDNLNRLTNINYPSTAEDVTYAYDTAASGEDCNESSGSTSSYGRLCRVTKGSATTDYTYSALGRITKEKIRPIGTFALATDYAYNSAGELTDITYPGGRTVEVTRGNGQVSELASSFGTTPIEHTLATATAYQPFGGLLAYDLPTDDDPLRYEKSFDIDGHFSQWQVIVPNGNDPVLGYQHDAYGNISQITNVTNSIGHGTYTYDALNRLKTAAGPYGQYEYEYDDVGNRTQQTKRNWVGNGYALEDKWVETYQYDTGSTGNNRLIGTERFAIVNSTPETTPYKTRDFTYDGRGNIKQDVRTTGSTTYTLDLIYGNADRLDHVDVQ